LSKGKLFLTTIILSIAILVTILLAGCTSQPIELQNASEARDVALSYLDDQYTENVPAKDLIWQEYVTTPEGLIGSETREFVSDDWKVTVSYPVVLPENTVYDVIVFSSEVGWHWKGNVKADGTVTELNGFKQLTKEESQNIALEFVKNSPTFVFDGIEETLKLSESIEVSIPYTWTFVLHFESAHAGYGYRTGTMLAEVITPHVVSVTVEHGEIKYASMDDKWDMMQQKEIDASPGPPSGVQAAPNDSIVTANVIDIITATGNFPWELVIEIQNSEDVPGFGNFTKERVGETISVRTQEDISQLEKGRIITAHVRLQGDEWTRVLIATDIKLR